MDAINLPLILVVATFVGIAIYAYDFLVLRKPRQSAIAQLRKQMPQWDKADTDDAKKYQEAEPLVASEPWWVKETKSLLPILLLVLVVRSFIVEPFQIPSSSMEPTLDIGDFILVNKFTYGLRLPVIRTKVVSINEPERGDVMVFFPPHDKRYFIKRVIGVPGDVVEYRNKVLYVNGKEQEQTLLINPKMDIQSRDLAKEDLSGVEHQIFIKPYEFQKPFKEVVKGGHYFMMGDNRDNSSDSRSWGQVPQENIVGKAFAIWMHWKDWGSLPSFSRVGVIK